MHKNSYSKLSHGITNIILMILLAVGGVLLITFFSYFFNYLANNSLSILLNERGSLLSAGCLLLASQIAGFSVIASINNAKEIEARNEKLVEIKEHKIILTYYQALHFEMKHHREEMKGNMDFIKDIKTISKLYYSLSTKYYIEIYSELIVKLENIELHKTTSVEILSHIMIFKSFIATLKRQTYLFDNYEHSEIECTKVISAFTKVLDTSEGVFEVIKEVISICESKQIKV
ncbi:MAG: hypothetical protein HRT41_04915 [Campylobacteraceae bacterium]|nr:hypothetical protein [Campylobacteraceae bacterium]